MVEVLVPLAVTDVGLALITDCAALTVPGVKVTLAEVPMAVPPIVPLITAGLPAVEVGAVHVTVNVPL
jgi:hypothetical protein